MTKSPLVDFHCHLDLFPDYVRAFAECDRVGIEVFTMTTTPRAWLRNWELAEKHKHIRPGLGLHPQLIAERGSEIKLWEDLLPRAKFVGEVGLDAGPCYVKSFEDQKQVFQRILRACNEAGGRILSVHSIRSAKTVLDMIERWLPPQKGKIILHWFTGGRTEAKRAVQLGCFFSVNHQMLHNPKNREMIAEIPADRILTETDGPFTKLAGKPCTPMDVTEVLKGLGAIWKKPVEDVGTIVFRNMMGIDAMV